MICSLHNFFKLYTKECTNFSNKMSSIILLILFIGTISASFKPEQEFEVKQSSILNNGRSYTFVINFVIYHFFLLII